MSERIGVTGGRDYRDIQEVRFSLMVLPADAIVVHGHARGLDTLVHLAWQIDFGGIVEPHDADWYGACRPSCRPGHRRRNRLGDYCPAAGNYRNQEVVDSGLDRLLIFPGDRGTRDMTLRARRAGVLCIRQGYRIEEQGMLL